MWAGARGRSVFRAGAAASGGGVPVGVNCGVKDDGVGDAGGGGGDAGAGVGCISDIVIVPPRPARILPQRRARSCRARKALPVRRGPIRFCAGRTTSRSRTMRVLLAGLAVLWVCARASAQKNLIDGLDTKMSRVEDPQVMGRTGTFATGMNGMAFSGTICNIGTVDVEWRAAMRPHHPFISFIVVRESNGRLEQISDRSFVKHTFFATNGSDCSTCTNSSDPTVLAVGCSDTYGTATNGDRYWLGPPDEIDPWLGKWEPDC